MSRRHTERAVLRLVGRSHHWQAGADPAAAGEPYGRVGLGHCVQGLQGGQGEVVDLVSDAGLGAGAVFRASALEVETDMWTNTSRQQGKAFDSNPVWLEENTVRHSFIHMLLLHVQDRLLSTHIFSLTAILHAELGDGVTRSTWSDILP